LHIPDFSDAMQITANTVAYFGALEDSQDTMCRNAMTPSGVEIAR